MIVNESDGTDDASLKFEKIIDGMKCYTIENIEFALYSAGFSEVRSFHHESKPWIAVIAQKLWRVFGLYGWNNRSFNNTGDSYSFSGRRNYKKDQIRLKLLR